MLGDFGNDSGGLGQTWKEDAASYLETEPIWATVEEVSGSGAMV